MDDVQLNRVEEDLLRILCICDREEFTPSIANLMEISGRSEAAIRAALERLVQLGFAKSVAPN